MGRFFALPDVATTIAAAITVVGVAYFFLLRSVWDPQGWQLIADIALHYLTPVLFIAYWWLDVPKETISWADIPKWLLYSSGYLVYALVRGSLTGLYPYHFIDVPTQGYRVAMTNAMGVLLGFALVAAVLVAASRLSKPIR